jgi:hypothetical protein
MPARHPSHRSRRNPATSSSLVPLAIIAGGLALYAYGKKQDRANGLQGMGDLGFSVRRALSRAAAPVKKAVHQVVPKAITNAVNKVGKPIEKVVSKTYDAGAKVAKFAAPLVTGVTIGIPLIMGREALKMYAKRQAPKDDGSGGTVNVYTDDKGNTITEAQYNALQACYNQGGDWSGGRCQIPQPAPGASQPEQPASPAPNPWTTPQQPYPTSNGGGSGGSGAPSASDYYAQQQQPQGMPSYAASAEPAPAGKVNPLLAAAAFIAVPAVMLLTGGK